MVRIRPPIVLFGDSITQFAYGDSALGEPVSIGWASLLSSAYQRRADVLNRGFSGYNTRHALELVPRVFGDGNNSNNNSSKDNNDKNRPLFCTVFFGANDAALPSETSDSGRQHVPRDEYRDNLERILTRIREATSDSSSSESDPVPIIVLTPPPVDEERWRTELGLYDHFDRTNAASFEYGAAAKAAAASLDHCPVLDTWELLGGGDGDNDNDGDGDSDKKNFRRHLSDGLHLSDSGNRLVYEGIMDLIRSRYPHLAPAADDDGDNNESPPVGIRAEEPLWHELC